MDNELPIQLAEPNPPSYPNDPEAAAHAFNNPPTLHTPPPIPPIQPKTEPPPLHPPEIEHPTNISVILPDGTELLVPPTSEEANGRTQKFRQKRSILQRENDLQLTAEMHLKGHSSYDIANHLNATRTYSLSRQQIDNDINEIHKRWEVKYGGKTHKVRLKELAKLDILEAEAWAAWKNSQRDGKEQMQVSSPAPNGGAVISKTIKSAKQRDGDAKFLKVLLDVSERKAKLLGLDKVDEATVDHLKNLPPELMDNMRARFKQKLLAEVSGKSEAPVTR